MSTKRNSIFALGLIVLTLLFWVEVKALLGDKAYTLWDLENEQIELNEQLISAQILANKLDQVYSLFEGNLALSKSDSLAEDASMPFMNDLTRILNDLEIILISIKPKHRDDMGNRILSPYELVLKCSYSQLGAFITEVERSPRLVGIKEFFIKNGIERLKRTVTEAQLEQQEVELSLYTLTLVKNYKRGDYE